MKKPAKCNNSTESITSTNSPDKSDWMQKNGDISDADDALNIEDLSRTKFSEIILRNNQ